MLDGFYLVRNTKTGKVNVLSITSGVAHMHYVYGQPMAIEQIVHMEATGQFDIFESFKMTQSEKQKNNKTTKYDD